MSEKPIQKGKKTNPKKVEKEAAASEEAENLELARLQSLQADFLELNGNCPQTALLAACELLFEQAEEISVLRHSSSAGFNRGFNQSCLNKT